MFKAHFRTTFKHSYKRLDPEIQRRVDDAIRGLLASEDPAAQGERKYGRWTGAYSYEIGRRFRILYAVDRKAEVVIFLDVGTHAVYR